MFHATDGWHFHRLPDGSVRVTKQRPTVRHDEFGFVADGDARYVVLEDVTFDPGTWASIVASVSKSGETGETYRRAEMLHRGDGAV